MNKNKKKGNHKKSKLADTELAKRARAFSKEKALGQNFLISEFILDEIVAVADLDPEKDSVLEIGAGIGFLTERLLPHVKELTAVELDRDTAVYLKIIEAANRHCRIVFGDILAQKLSDLFSPGQKVKIVANIPYQITSRIILYLLGEMGADCENRKYISDIYILVQKEFAERLCAKPGTKAFGSMTLLLDYWAEVEYLFDVPAECFDPVPRVDSAFIRIHPRPEPKVQVSNPLKLRRLIKAIYANRRKTLNNGLKAAGYDKELVESLNLGNIRGETLDLEKLLDLLEKLT